MLHEHNEGTMRRWIPRLFALGMVGASLPAFQGCSDYSPNVVIMANLAAKPPECTYTASEDPTYWSRGRLDLGLTSSYQAHLMFGNATAENGDAELQRVDTNEIYVDGAEVRLLQGDQEIASFTTEAGGYAASGSGTSQGLGITSVTLVPGTRAVYDALKGLLGPELKGEALIYTETQLFGRTASGSTFKTPVFTYPITICYGCLVVFPDGDGGAKACPVKPDSFTEGVCVFGQDSRVPCTVCVGTAPADVCGTKT